MNRAGLFIQPGWISKALCWMKIAKAERSHPEQFHSEDILETANVQRWGQISGCQGLGAGGEEKGRCKCEGIDEGDLCHDGIAPVLAVVLAM